MRQATRLTQVHHRSDRIPKQLQQQPEEEDSGLSPGSALLKEANDHVQRATKLRRRVAQLDPVLDESLIKETESNIEGLEQKAQALKRKAMEV